MVTLVSSTLALKPNSLPFLFTCYSYSYSLCPFNPPLSEPHLHLPHTFHTAHSSSHSITYYLDHSVVTLYVSLFELYYIFPVNYLYFLFTKTQLLPFMNLIVLSPRKMSLPSCILPHIVLPFFVLATDLSCFLFSSSHPLT